MQIGIIGTGNVGSTLGRRLGAIGHSIVYGTREPDSERVASLLAGHPGQAAAVPVDRACVGCELAVIAVPWEAIEPSLHSAAPPPGTILVDATNPIKPALSGLTLGCDTSGAEVVAAFAPQARVVKALNTVGWQIMADPRLDGAAAMLTVCGDDPEAKLVVMALAADLGFDPVDLGPLTSARYTEPLAMVWITLAHVLGQGPDVALCLRRR